MGLTPHRLGVCLLVVALVTAGCQAPIADGGTATPATTPADNETERLSAPNITVLNGSLELDPGRVFARVQAVSGTNVTPPRAVRVYNTSDAFYNSTPSGTTEPILPRFWRVAGLSTADVNSSALEIAKNGDVTGRGDVAIYLGPNTTLADERLLLAHEFTHYVQIQQGQQSDLNGALGGTTTQAAYLARSIIEGGAIYTTDSYVREYAPGEKLNSPWYDEIQASYPVGHVTRFQNARYIYGHDYVSTQRDSPTNRSAVYENPPQTTEQLLHGLGPGEEPPTELSVESSTGDDWLASGTDTMGEAFVRHALAGDVGRDRAQRAAAGWGNDHLQIFRPFDGGDTGYVWVLDWDDTANATEFERTLRTALDARGNETGGVWSLSDVNASASVKEVSEETTAVVFGPDAFVSATSVNASEGSVRVDVAE
jgi:hypothetical protein